MTANQDYEFSHIQPNVEVATLLGYPSQQVITVSSYRDEEGELVTAGELASQMHMALLSAQIHDVATPYETKLAARKFNDVMDAINKEGA